MYDACLQCNAVRKSSNEAAELYVNEAGKPVAVMWGQPDMCEKCNLPFQPHVCPDLHRFESAESPPTLVTVRMCKLLDVTEHHKLRILPSQAAEVASAVAALTHAVTTVFIGSARETARPRRR